MTIRYLFSHNYNEEVAKRVGIKIVKDLGGPYLPFARLIGDLNYCSNVFSCMLFYLVKQFIDVYKLYNLYTVHRLENLGA